MTQRRKSCFKGGPNPREGYKSASGLGPGGPNPLADLDRGVQIRGGVKIRCDTGGTKWSEYHVKVLALPRPGPGWGEGGGGGGGDLH